MRLRILPLLATVMLLASAPQAYAANCASPTEPEGNLLCNKDYHVLQYCDGTNWIPAGRAGLDSGLVGWWTFNDGSGGTAADASGNGNNGTVDGASWTTGQLGGALSFDGADD